MEEKYISIAAVAIVLILGGWFLLKGAPAKAPTTANETPTAAGLTPAATTTAGVAASTVVIYTDQGFSPSSIAIPFGANVVFINQSSEKMWVASDAHPSHTAYSGTSVSQHCPDAANTAFDQCTAIAFGGLYAFTFEKAGTWKYHNHVNSTRTGVVTVAAAATP